jgi:hypothetical protein
LSAEELLEDEFLKKAKREEVIKKAKGEEVINTEANFLRNKHRNLLDGVHKDKIMECL